MASYQLTCVDCGDSSHTVTRSDAKYCPSCKLRRALEYVESGRHRMRSTRKCRVCGVPYRMTHGKDLKTCGHCDTAALDTTTKAGLPACSWCSGKVHPRSALPSVCLECQSDPASRKKLVRGLRKGFSDRKLANRTGLAALAAGTSHLRRIDS